ncbi:MAG: hypothetical protein F6K65_30400 [Moorea sp. SIO3C2]|nr:hypothetical protein [Moorena sp. SIO3C2]
MKGLAWGEISGAVVCALLAMNLASPVEVIEGAEVNNIIQSGTGELTRKPKDKTGATLASLVGLALLADAGRRSLQEDSPTALPKQMPVAAPEAIARQAPAIAKPPVTHKPVLDDVWADGEDDFLGDPFTPPTGAVPTQQVIKPKAEVKSGKAVLEQAIAKLPQERKSRAIAEKRTQESVAIPSEIHEILDEGCIWLMGRKGSEKTSKLEFIAEHYIDQGYEVWVMDPHCRAGQWDGLKVYGSGMDYRAIAKGLQAFTDEMDRRYKRRAKDPSYDPMNDKRIIVICEEMTKWGQKVDPKVMADFMGCVLADIRKANGGAVFVSHGETLAMFGGRKALEGFRDAIDTDVAKIYCFSEPVKQGNTKNLKAKPFVQVLFPGETQRVSVTVGNSMRAKGTHFKTAFQIEQNLRARESNAIAQATEERDRQEELQPSNVVAFSPRVS